MEASEKIIIALDFPEEERALNLVDILGSFCRIYKVGSELFASAGSKIIEKLRSRGKDVFLDLKFHDIPNTVGRVSRLSTQLGVRIFNVHAFGGSQMMKAAKEESLKAAEMAGQDSPLVLAVTILTSLTSDVLVDELKILSTVENQTIHFARLAQDSGLDGVVCSPFEIEGVREACGEKFVVLTPGIRPKWAAANDQKRFKTPVEAVKEGADFIVVGRPVTQSENPRESMDKIIREISGVKS
ncbi:MAG: orotidine-5'-phosphate decarboxylase [Candidatus Aureabacteria bacterium]|nr:orotidine-5'-phosphate decarboxylase [Candidatus Auribacterota bacterium]